MCLFFQPLSVVAKLSNLDALDRPRKIFLKKTDWTLNYFMLTKNKHKTALYGLSPNVTQKYRIFYFFLSNAISFQKLSGTRAKCREKHRGVTGLGP